MWYQVQQDYVNELMNVTRVPFQATRCTKSFIAHIAFVRLLVRVNTLFSDVDSFFVLPLLLLLVLVVSREELKRRVDDARDV